MPLTPCWPPPVITSISCLGGWSSCCLDSWRLRTQRPPFNGSENRKLHGRLGVSDPGSGPAAAQSADGLGTRIVETLARQINAAVAKERLSNGYKVTVTVPLL